MVNLQTNPTIKSANYLYSAGLNLKSQGKHAKAARAFMDSGQQLEEFENLPGVSKAICLAMEQAGLSFAEVAGADGKVADCFLRASRHARTSLTKINFVRSAMEHGVKAGYQKEDFLSLIETINGADAANPPSQPLDSTSTAVPVGTAISAYTVARTPVVVESVYCPATPYVNPGKARLLRYPPSDPNAGFMEIARTAIRGSHIERQLVAEARKARLSPA